jgi:hypothetical protein
MVDLQVRWNRVQTDILEREPDGFSCPQTGAGEQADQRVGSELLQRAGGPHLMCGLKQAGDFL